MTYGGTTGVLPCAYNLAIHKLFTQTFSVKATPVAPFDRDGGSGRAVDLDGAVGGGVVPRGGIGTTNARSPSSSNSTRLPTAIKLMRRRSNNTGPTIPRPPARPPAAAANGGMGDNGSSGGATGGTGGAAGGGGASGSPDRRRRRRRAATTAAPDEDGHSAMLQQQRMPMQIRWITIVTDSLVITPAPQLKQNESTPRPSTDPATA